MVRWAGRDEGYDMASDWSTLNSALLRAAEADLISAALAAAEMVASTWTTAAPPEARDAPLLALNAVRKWRANGGGLPEMKSLAAAAYAAVGHSGLPPGGPRHAALSAAHAAFALAFWNAGERQKVLEAARAAIANAEAVTGDGVVVNALLDRLLAAQTASTVSPGVMRQLLFQVEGLKREGSRCYVAGRNCEASVRIEDQFTTLAPRLQTVGNPIRLRVERILTYGKYLNQIDPGLTAELELSGAEIGALAPFDIHGTSYLPLFADTELLGEGDFHVDRQ